MAKGEDSCVILTEGGVGYEVHLPKAAAPTIGSEGEVVCLHVHTIVREDALELYGFPTRDERQVFGLLLSITKLGPKTSAAILSTFTPSELRRVVAGENPDALTAVPGIGKKSAQRIFLELKYKLKPVPGEAMEPSKGPENTVYRDAMTGLLNLGYSEDEAKPALEEVLEAEPDLDVASALRQALKTMAKARQ